MAANQVKEAWVLDQEEPMTRLLVVAFGEGNTDVLYAVLLDAYNKAIPDGNNEDAAKSLGWFGYAGLRNMLTSTLQTDGLREEAAKSVRRIGVLAGGTREQIMLAEQTAVQFGRQSGAYSAHPALQVLSELALGNMQPVE